MTKGDAILDAMVLGQMIALPVELAGMRQIEKLLLEHIDQTPLKQTATILDKAFLAMDPALRWKLFRRHYEPVVVHALLPPLRRRLCALAAAGGEPTAGREPAAMDVAATFRVLVDWACFGDGAEVGRALRHELGREALAAAQHLLDRQTARLAGADYPDLSEIGAELRRLDELCTTLEEVGDTLAVPRLRKLTVRLAMGALEATSRTLETFLAQRELLSMFDAIGVLAQADVLVVMLDRILDAGQDAAAERTAFVLTPEEQAMARFLKLLAPLADVLAAAALRSVGRPEANQALFRGVLRQLGYLDRLCQEVRHPKRPPPLSTVHHQIREHFAGITAQICTAMTGALKQSNSAAFRLAIQQAQSVADAIEQTDALGAAFDMGL